MLSAPTVLILGAGSSVDFGLPSGAQLKNEARAQCDFWFDDQGRLERGNSEFYEMLAEEIGRENVIPVSRTVVQAIPSFKSIDDFLFSHSHDERIKKVGKMAIARVIARAEQTSVVKSLSHHDVGSRTQAEEHVRVTWIGTLIQLLATGVSRPKVDMLFKNLTVISFNYDRCVERILYQLIQPTFDIDEKEAAEVMRGLKVIRPYGGLGALHCSGEPSTTPFGPSLSDALALSQRIRVYTEDSGEDFDLEAARNAISTAYTVVFLGFGYHKQNMKLLEIAADAPRPQRVYATTFGEPAPAMQTINKRCRP